MLNTVAFYALLLLPTQAAESTIRVPGQAAAPIRINRMVEIGKAKFRVRVRGDTAEVRRKNLMFNADAQHFELVKNAAELASKCAAVEQSEQPEGLFMGASYVRLDCTRQPTQSTLRK